jgi:hypothetical protein
VDVHNTVWGRSWQGGSPGTRLITAGTEQLRPELVALGMTHAEVDEIRDLLGDPRVTLHGHLMHATSGRRPASRGTD